MVEYPQVSVKNLLTNPTLDIFDRATVSRIRHEKENDDLL